MPTPKKGESKSKFISRCVSYLYHNEGITDTDHAVAKCNGIWEQSKKKSLMEKAWDICKDILRQNKE
jgi:hypothetical protein